MAERIWTPAQSAAIHTRDKTLLVSAAAGSGKTAVLTERIIQSLTDEVDPADISRMLIVTFTRAAAAQLRQKISSALSKRLALDPGNAHLSRQLMMLGSAHISTIDSFYMDVVKQNFQASGLPPTFRMADEAELSALRREIMNETIDLMYAEEPAFSAVSDIFCDIRNETSLCTALLELAEHLDQYPESVDILARSAKELRDNGTRFLETPFGKVWLRTVTDFAKSGVFLFETTLRELQSEEQADKLERKYGERYREVLERCREILQTVETYEAELAEDIKEQMEECAKERTLLEEGEELDPDAENTDHLHSFHSHLLYAELRMRLTMPFDVETDKSRPKASEEFTKWRTLCDNFIKKWEKTAPVWGANDPISIVDSATDSARMLSVLHQTLTLYQKEYTAAKRGREIAEFSDISRAAYRMLVAADGSPTPLAKELSGNFDAIYIDEYQDVNAMQDATFRAIATERNRFMVGDIKQSIYRFRGAQPKVFADYRKSFAPLDRAGDAPEATVFMSNCFRCDENVIRFSNAVSGFLFSRTAESIGYTKEDDLVFSKDPQKSGSALCEVMLLEPLSSAARGEKLEGAVLEARMIAEEISQLLENGKKADGTPIRPGDIAILGRTATHFPHVTKELNARGIPVSDTSKQSFFENPEVLCTYSLLVAIDNPYRDVYFAAALRSPFFGVTLEEMVKVRNLTKGSLSLYESFVAAAGSEAIPSPLRDRIKDILTRLATYREKARTLPVDKLLRYLYRVTAAPTLAGYEQSGQGGTVRKANLNRLYEYARKFESGGFKGLYQFIRYVDNVMQSGAKLSQPEGNGDAVLLSTIHGSKGLEFPVCFLISAQTAFSRNDLTAPLLSDEHLGCALRLSNAGPFSRYDTFFRAAAEMELRRQSREEEMRILYVGMTRAIEKLYVTAALSGKAEKAQSKAQLQALPGIGELALEDNNYISWILAALERPDAKEFSRIRHVSEEALNKTIADRKERRRLQEERLEEESKDETPSDTLRENERKDMENVHAALGRFEFVYPFAHLTRLPAKLSVSKLSPIALDVYDSEGVPSATETEHEEAERLLHTFERRPVFGKKAPTAAQRGTATHEFLQFCDFARAEENGVENELARLVQERFLPPETSEAVRIDELKRFFESKFYHALKAAEKLRREVRFHIFLPAADFTADKEFAERLADERLAVQGVIDLFYTDAEGRLVLCDYKTDRLTPYELSHPEAAAKKLSERHGKQLSYYARALEEICGRAPERVLIYSLPLGEAVECQLPR